MHGFDPEWSIKNIIKLEKRKSEIDSHSLCEQQQQQNIHQNIHQNVQQNVQQDDNNEKMKRKWSQS